MLQGDTKGSAKGGEASAKKDVQPSPNAQVEYTYTHVRVMLNCILLECQNS